MSGGDACRCSERKEPLLIDHVNSNRPLRLWRVLQRECNHSAFSGYHYTPSDWSSVKCLRCGNIWRTKAGYVQFLEDITQAERDMPRADTTSIDGVDMRGKHAQMMIDMGREPYTS